MKHKKLIKLLVLIIMSMSTLVIYKYNNNHNINYTALGDGYSKGINSLGINEYGYSDFLKDKLKESSNLKTYLNYSNKYMSINDLINSIITNKNVMYKNKKTNLKVILRESDIITVSIGLNDLHYYNSLNDKQCAEKIIAKYEELLKEIKKYYPHKIIVIGYNEQIVQEQSISKLNNYLKNNNKVIYIDTNNLKKINKRKNNYNIYYDSYQYEEIARKIREKLNKNLKI